jgi:hypothetical protein
VDPSQGSDGYSSIVLLPLCPRCCVCGLRGFPLRPLFFLALSSSAVCALALAVLCCGAVVRALRTKEGTRKDEAEHGGGGGKGPVRPL